MYNYIDSFTNWLKKKLLKKNVQLESNSKMVDVFNLKYY